MDNQILYDVAREVLSNASAAALQRRRKAQAEGNIDEACDAAYEKGRIDSERERLNVDDPKQMQQAMDRWGLKK